MELIYDDATISAVIAKRWPQAKITDARDDIHDERFEVEIEGLDEDEFYKFAFYHDFLAACFCFRMQLGLCTAEEDIKKLKAKLERWKKEGLV